MDEQLYLKFGKAISHLANRGLAKVHPQLGVKVSPSGEVFLPQSGTNKAHWTFGCKNSRGYRQVRIKGTRYCVHRLVAETFIGEVPEGFDADHINRIKDDNRVENLRIVTHRENCHNTTLHDRVVSRGGTHSYEDEKQYWREQSARFYQAKCKTHRVVHFADGTRHWIPLTEAEALLAIPLSQRIFKE